MCERKDPVSFARQLNNIAMEGACVHPLTKWWKVGLSSKVQSCLIYIYNNITFVLSAASVPTMSE